MEKSIDFFFIIQYRCYLEECPTLSQTPAKRRDHCISEHKFPHDFRFDSYNQTKKTSNKGNSKPSTSKQSSILQPSKLVSVASHDEDIELEDKSILLTAQRKQFTNFSFGHKKTKTFRSNVSNSQSYAKQLTAKSDINKNQPQSGLDNTNLVDELMESLPQ